MGLLFCVVIPSLEDHGAANSYVGRVILEVMPALASGTLVPGVIALMRQVNRVRRRASRPESEEVPSC